jgi:hypothetical protein
LYSAPPELALAANGLNGMAPMAAQLPIQLMNDAQMSNGLAGVVPTGVPNLPNETIALD